MAGRLAANPGESLDEFLKVTGAGSVCTACMLDVEYNFVNLPRPVRPDRVSGRAPRMAQKSFKRRIYDFVDKLPPFIPRNLENWMPVLSGPRVESWLWTANHPMLYREASRLQPLTVDLELYDAEGAMIGEWHYRVALGEYSRIEVSEPLADVWKDSARRGTNQDELAIGSLRIVHRWPRPAIRGTTRPQLELVTPSAASAVHGQGVRGAPKKRISLRYRPEDQRFFFTVMNVGRKDMPITFRYPVAPAPIPSGCAPLEETLTVPAGGARLYSLEPPSDLAKEIASKMITVEFAGVGVGRVHAVCSSKDLARFSMDHL